jgi:hypothetical protein
MGTLAPTLLEALQREFGPDRVCVRGQIVKAMRIETLPEAFEIIERHAQTELCGWFSNDMILPVNWMDYVFATMRYFREYKNFSMHFARRDLFESCRKDISLDNVASADWPNFFENFRKRCRSRLHTLGYDCYVWNHIGINMTAAQVEPFFIGRPNFDGAIMRKQMQQGWLVTAYPELLTYHLEHPDRVQFTKRPKHPDTKYNTDLFLSLGSPQWRNVELDTRISLNGIMQRRNETWYNWALDRPEGTLPLGYPPIGPIKPASPK